MDHAIGDDVLRPQSGDRGRQRRGWHDHLTDTIVVDGLVVTSGNEPLIDIRSLRGGIDIATGSLHGWAWILPAPLGKLVGLRLRPLFGLGNPEPTDSVC